MRPDCRLLLALSLGLLASCATTNPYHPARLADTTTGCVHAASQLHAVPTPWVTPDTTGDKASSYVQFADVSQCLIPDGAPAEAAALFHLAPLHLPAKLTIRVLLAPGGTLPASVTLLDDAFRPIRSYDFATFTKRRSDFSKAIFLNPSDSAVRYALVVPDQTFLGKDGNERTSVGGPVPVNAGGVLFLLVLGHEHVISYPFERGGGLSVNLGPADTSSVVAHQ